MKNKLKNYRHGYVAMERAFPSGLYVVKVYKGDALYDKVRCDDYSHAMSFYKAFCRIAKAN